MKASVFYDGKENAKLRAKNDKRYVAIAMDYQKMYLCHLAFLIKYDIYNQK